MTRGERLEEEIGIGFDVSHISHLGIKMWFANVHLGHIQDWADKEGEEGAEEEEDKDEARGGENREGRVEITAEEEEVNVGECRVGEEKVWAQETEERVGEDRVIDEEVEEGKEEVVFPATEKVVEEEVGQREDEGKELGKHEEVED